MLQQDPSRDYARRSVFARTALRTVSQPSGRIAPDRVSRPFARFEQRQALELRNLKGRSARPDTHRCTRRDACAHPRGDTMPRTPLSAARWTETSLSVALCLLPDSQRYDLYGRSNEEQETGRCHAKAQSREGRSHTSTHLDFASWCVCAGLFLPRLCFRLSTLNYRLLCDPGRLLALDLFPTIDCFVVSGHSPLGSGLSGNSVKRRSASELAT